MGKGNNCFNSSGVSNGLTAETLRFNVMLQIDGSTYIDGEALENSYAKLVGEEILIDVYGILEELDTVFKYDDSSLIPFPNKSGEGNYMFHISEVGTLNDEIYFSPYITKFNDRDLLFTKLPEAISVVIDSGHRHAGVLVLRQNLLDDIQFVRSCDNLYLFHTRLRIGKSVNQRIR